jgi:phosphoribosyl 1,2-cyclic phosphodiesterase
VGYKIEVPDEDGNIYRIGYATDIGYVSPEIEEALTGCDAVILESNHDYDMLMTGPYPYDLKMRVASRRGHLSNEDSALLACRLCAAGTRSLMLAHLSAENNTPQLAYDAHVTTLADPRLRVAVAAADEPVELCGTEETALC